MTEQRTDLDIVRAALQRLNPQFHENDESWAALVRIEGTRGTSKDVSTQHTYVPGPWTQAAEAALVGRYGSWADVPNDMRYSDCTCGKPWKAHR